LNLHCAVPFVVSLSNHELIFSHDLREMGDDDNQEPPAVPAKVAIQNAR
jgi:hypothetical protein